MASRLLYGVWSIAVLFFLPVAVKNYNLFDEPVLTIFDLHTSERYVYSREIDGQVHTFIHDGEDAVRNAAGKLWSISSGRPMGDPDSGKILSPIPLEEVIFPYKGVSLFPNVWLSLWQRFDANWYSAIALHGYGQISGDVHFPPLYPLLIRLLLPVTGHPLLTGLLLSHLAVIGMLAALYDFVDRRFAGQRIAARTLIYLMAFPASFFFYSAYTESLFIWLALLFLNAVHDKKWHRAGLWTFCAILVRLQGVALLLPLAIELYRARKTISWRDLIFAVLLPGAAVALYLFIRWISGDPSVVPLFEARWNVRLAFPWENYWYALTTLFSGRAGLMDVLNLLTTILFVLLIILGWRRFDLSLNLYLVASLVVLTSRVVDTQPLCSMVRYVLTLFPVFILLAAYGQSNPRVHRLVIYTGFALSLFLSAQFWLWGWVA